MEISFYQTNYETLKSDLLTAGYKSKVADDLFNWHYKKRQKEPCGLILSKDSRSYIESKYSFNLPTIDTVSESTDKTVKFLFQLSDGHKVETVLIPFHNKYSVCLSSQVGCAMNCSFCFTGTQGFKRNLRADEIMGQYLESWRWLRDNRPGEENIPNIVFMGQGEPLHNFDEVKTACEILLDQHGTSIGSQKITISTSGFLPGLKRWNEEMPSVNLALSLHSPFIEKRNELIPINKKYKLAEVLNYIDQLNLQKKQFVTYEYLLIEGFNDFSEDAHETGKLLQGKRAYINLIPFNPFPGSKYKRPSKKSVDDFKVILDTYKIPTLIREAKGDDVLAACGQLNTSL